MHQHTLHSNSISVCINTHYIITQPVYTSTHITQHYQCPHQHSLHNKTNSVHINTHCTITQPYQCTHQQSLHNNTTSVHINTLPATQHNPPAHHRLFGQETQSVQQYSQSAHWHGDLYKILSKLCLRMLTTIYCLVPSWQYSSMLSLNHSSKSHYCSSVHCQHIYCTWSLLPL